MSNGKNSAVRYFLMVAAYAVVFALCHFTLANKEAYMELYKTIEGFNGWFSDYIVWGNIIIAIMSLVLIAIWELYFTLNHLHAANFRKTAPRFFFLFLILQLLACVVCISLSRRLDDEMILYYPLLYVIPFLTSTIFLSGESLNDKVLPLSRYLWFKITFAVVALVILAAVPFI